MDKQRISILGVGIDPVTMAEAVGFCEQRIASRQPAEIITANAEMIMQANTNPALKQAMTDAALVIADGAGVILAARRYGMAFPERVAGYDLSLELLKVAAQKRYRVYFLGSAPGVAETAAVKMAGKYRGLNVVGIHDGYFAPAAENEIIKNIQQARPDILLVALGVPRQELWIEQHLAGLEVPVCIGVGGSLDVMAGIVKRAPRWMQRSHIEWLYRLLKQPTRFVRMLNLPRFALRVLFTRNYQ